MMSDKMEHLLFATRDIYLGIVFFNWSAIVRSDKSGAGRFQFIVSDEYLGSSEKIKGWELENKYQYSKNKSGEQVKTFLRLGTLSANFAILKIVAGVNYTSAS